MSVRVALTGYLTMIYVIIPAPTVREESQQAAGSNTGPLV